MTTWRHLVKPITLEPATHVANISDHEDILLTNKTGSAPSSLIGNDSSTAASEIVIKVGLRQKGAAENNLLKLFEIQATGEETKAMLEAKARDQMKRLGQAFFKDLLGGTTDLSRLSLQRFQDGTGLDPDKSIEEQGIEDGSELVVVMGADTGKSQAKQPSKGMSVGRHGSAKVTEISVKVKIISPLDDAHPFFQDLPVTLPRGLQTTGEDLIKLVHEKCAIVDYKPKSSQLNGKDLDPKKTIGQQGIINGSELEMVVVEK